MLLDSEIKLNEIRNEPSPDVKKAKIGKKVVKADDPLMLLSFPGVKLSERARKALLKKAGIKEDIKH